MVSRAHPTPQECWFVSRAAAPETEPSAVRTMAHRLHDIGIASQIGRYSDAVEIEPNARWLWTAGTPGLTLHGDLPADITGQAEIAWTHILNLLERAGMTVTDIVKVTQYLVSDLDISAYAAVRSRLLVGRSPALQGL